MLSFRDSAIAKTKITKDTHVVVQRRGTEGRTRARQPVRQLCVASQLVMGLPITGQTKRGRQDILAADVLTGIGALKMYLKVPSKQNESECVCVCVCVCVGVYVYIMCVVCCACVVC